MQGLEGQNFVGGLQAEFNDLAGLERQNSYGSENQQPMVEEYDDGSPKSGQQQVYDFNEPVVQAPIVVQKFDAQCQTEVVSKDAIAQTNTTEFVKEAFA